MLAHLQNNEVRIKNASMNLFFMCRRLRFLKPVVPPRTTFQYTNTLYALMGQVSEHLSGGTSWEDLIEENFFVPLGMSSSTFIYRSLPELTGHATPYVMMGEEVLQTPWQMFMQVFMSS